MSGRSGGTRRTLVIRRANTATYGALALLLGTAACGRGEEVTHFRVAKRSAKPAGAAMPAGMPGMPGGVPGMGDDAAAPGARLRWTLPKGWTESSGGPMR